MCQVRYMSMSRHLRGFACNLEASVLKTPLLMMQADAITDGCFLVTLNLWVSWASLKHLVGLLFSDQTLMDIKCNLHSV